MRTTSMVLLTSVMTGVFCAVCAIVVDLITNALEMWMVIAVAFVSGFTGSLLAQLLLKRER